MTGAADMGGTRLIEAHAMPQGDPAFGIEGHAVRLVLGPLEPRSVPPWRIIGFARFDALRAYHRLGEALRAFVVGGDFTAGDTPRLYHSDAEGVGADLADYFGKLGLTLIDGKGNAIERGNLAWADAVQRVLRLAAERQADREGRDG